MKIDWINLCIEMMIEYIPQELDTLERYNKFQEVCEHFFNLARFLGMKVKAERNIRGILTIDECEEIERVARIMKVLVRQMFGFAKLQREDSLAIATTALCKYEKILSNKEICVDQRTFLDTKISELRSILNSI